MNRILGILSLVLILYGLILASDPGARTLENHHRIAERLALYGMLTLGVSFVIISGGIDLSIGSVFGLAAILLGVLLDKGVSSTTSVLIVLAVGAGIGLLHGLLITKLKLQPFIVTLCGLFIFRGMAAWMALPDPLGPLQALARFFSFGALYPDLPLQTGSAANVGIGKVSSQVEGLIFLSTGYSKYPILSWVPVRLWLLLAIAFVAWVFLHRSVYGRYLFAIGANEQAARYAGISTDRYKILSYVLCSMLACVGGMMQLLELKTASPFNTGQWYELYAITGAVLGGCSLRGGEGSVIGVLLGTAVLPLLRSLNNFSKVLPHDLEFMIIGVALLLGTIGDELVKRRGSRPRQASPPIVPPEEAKPPPKLEGPEESG